jgi:hypothetical protein
VTRTELAVIVLGAPSTGVPVTITHSPADTWVATDSVNRVLEENVTVVCAVVLWSSRLVPVT